MARDKINEVAIGPATGPIALRQIVPVVILRMRSWERAVFAGQAELKAQRKPLKLGRQAMQGWEK